ncbi:ATP/GTP-binding protein [Streptomyces sp. NPDC002835]
MDTAALTSEAASETGSLLIGLIQRVWSVGLWCMANALWLGLVGLICACVWLYVQRRLAARALEQRSCVELVPSRQFATTPEEVLRFGTQLIRAASAGKWWTPRAARTVRIRMRSDGITPLRYQVEGPSSAEHLLVQTPYGPRVRTRATQPVRDKARKHTVRAVFALHGLPGAELREVPLEPDPLQPLIDAVADLREEHGDLAEVCVDLSPGVRWGLRGRRRRVMQGARERARRDARREARWATEDAASIQDSLLWQLSNLLSLRKSRDRLLMSPRPPRINRDEVLGKLTEDVGLVRVQIMVRCQSNTVGRAERRLRHVEAALDIFAARVRMSSLGWSLGPVRFGPDQWPWRNRFDTRWASGLIRPARDSWARVEELAGLLKPPTRHARLPLLHSDIPSYRPGEQLLPQGVHRGPDGRLRLLATREDDTLFEVQVGKAGWGKTMRALCQATASAYNGRGLAFVDPHKDSWATVAPYLAQEDLLPRVDLFDLTVRGDQEALGCWNPLGMHRGQAGHEVVSALVDGFATSLGWGDANAPRAITILTKAVEVLVALNAKAVAAGQPDCQATVLHIRPLLTDPKFRATLLACLGEGFKSEARWWKTSFPEIPMDALPTVLNPLDRLVSSPVLKAFLGSPVGTYDIRRAMDESRVVWICPPGSGPTDRLLLSLLVRDMLRAGLSRRDTPDGARRPFRVYLDELISLDGAASVSLAQITEQLRKFQVRLHAMTQLLHRISPEVRTALVQNASCLSTTAGSVEAIKHITDEWGGRVEAADAAELDRFEHWASFTVGGKRIGPVQIRGPLLAEVFPRRAANRARTARLVRAALHNTGAVRLPELIRIADGQEERVLTFASQHAGTTAQTGSITDTYEGQHR